MFARNYDESFLISTMLNLKSNTVKLYSIIGQMRINILEAYLKIIWKLRSDHMQIKQEVAMS